MLDVQGTPPEPFTKAWPPLAECFDRCQREVLTEFPDLHVITSLTGPASTWHYAATVEFWRDLTIQTWADLHLDLSCGLPDGHGGPPPEALPYTATFHVAGPGGRDLIVPLMEDLPPLPDAARHEAALRSLVDRACSALADAMPLVIETLRAEFSSPPWGE